MDYMGYTIEAAPRQLGEEGWDTLFFIERSTDGGVRARGFRLHIKCKTRTAAIDYCYRAARDIIDGKAQGMRVDDL